mgnify:CR=1 FL=1
MTAWAMRSSKTGSDGFACGFSNCSALENGASCSFADASVDAEARETKNRSKGLQWRRPDDLHCL